MRERLGVGAVRTTVLVVLVLAAGLTLVSPAGAMSVKTSHRPDTDFAGYESYAWVVHEEAAPDVEKSEIDGAIRSAATRRLERSGLALATDNPDLWLSYVLWVHDDLEVEGYKTEIAPGVSWAGDPDAHALIHHRRGALVIDARDAASGEVVWMGWATDVAGDPDRLPKRVKKAADRILRHFPPEP